MNKKNLQDPEILQFGFDAPINEWTTQLNSFGLFQPNTVFESDTWKFSGSADRQRKELDWRSFRSPTNRPLFSEVLGNDSFVDFAKKLLLAMMDEHRVLSVKLSIGPKKTNSLFDTVILTLGYCDARNCIEVSDVDDYARFLMMHSISTTSPSSPLRARRTPISFYSLKSRIADKAWASAASPATGWPQIGLVRPLNQKKYRNSQRQVIEEFYGGDLSWGDYRQGNSFDKLGLDDGQHFVAHCFYLIDRYAAIAKLIQDIHCRVPNWSKELEVRELLVRVNVNWILSGESNIAAGMAKPKYLVLHRHIEKITASHGIGNLPKRWAATNIYSEIEVNPAFNLSLPRQLVSLVASAAAVCFVALSGWRKSEYGFSKDDVLEIPNVDPLTQKDEPKRFFVRWFVPKTSGVIKETREITSTQYQLIELMSELNGSGKSSPCFFAKEPYSGPSEIDKLLSRPWIDFVEHGRMPNTLETKLREQLPVFKLIENFSTLGSAVIRGSYTGRPADERELIESLVSDRRKRALRANDPAAVSGLFGALSRALSHLEILRPNPHGLRHMWAEAVLRRFDGDVGWMIRSQFKHLSERFWRTYVRDKSARAIARTASIDVVSGLFSRVIKQAGKGYAGPTVKAVRRIFRATNMLTEKTDSAIEEFAATQIDHLNATPWGYCILRSAGRKRSKCSSDGSPQPQDASPSTCLSCTNFLTTEEHGEELIFIANTHSEIVLKEDIPVVFRKESARILKTCCTYLRQFQVELPEQVERAIRRLRREENTA